MGAELFSQVSTAFHGVPLAIPPAPPQDAERKRDDFISLDACGLEPHLAELTP